MFDFSAIPNDNNNGNKSMTAQQLFDDLDQTDTATAFESSKQQASSAPVSAQKQKNLSRTFKRYRRKSMAPLQSFDIDAVDENVQKEDEEEEKEEEEVIVDEKESTAVTVCEYHRNKG